MLRTSRWWRHVSHRPARRPVRYADRHISWRRSVEPHRPPPRRRRNGFRTTGSNPTRRSGPCRPARPTSKDAAGRSWSWRLTQLAIGVWLVIWRRAHSSTRSRPSARPTITSCATSGPYLAMGAALLLAVGRPSWRVAGALPGHARSTPFTRSTTCSTSAGRTRAGWALQLRRSLALADRWLLGCDCWPARARGHGADEGLRRRRDRCDRAAAGAAAGGAGHDVTAMTRSQDKRAAAARGGRGARVCDVFDAEALRRAVAAAQPEVVVHELTDLPPTSTRAGQRRPTRATTASAAEGTRNLVAAAQAAGARRIVAQSIAFAYAPDGRRGQGRGGAAVGRRARAVHATPWQRCTCSRTPSRVPRASRGWCCATASSTGPGSAYAAGGSLAREVRKRRFPVVGNGAGVFSFIHVDDAADATVAAVERGAPGHLQRRRRRAGADARLAAGLRRTRWAPSGRVACRSGSAGWRPALRGSDGDRAARGSNEKAKAELGWQPRHSSWREGFREALG